MSDHDRMCRAQHMDRATEMDDLGGCDCPIINAARADERRHAVVHSTGTDTGGPCCECCWDVYRLRDERERRVDVNVLRGFDLGLVEAEDVAARLVDVVCRLDADVRAEQAASGALLLSWRRTRAERDRARDEAAESTAHLINCRGDLAFAREDVARLRQEITEHIRRADVLRAVLTQVESDRDTAFADARASLLALVEAVDPASAPCNCDEPPCAWHTKDFIEALVRRWAK